MNPIKFYSFLQLKNFKSHLVLIFFFAIISFLLYYSIPNNTFLSDDYDSLNRIIIEHTILIREFFRPVIDISFLTDYSLFGLNPTGFYIVNLAIHIVNCYLVFLLVKKYLLFQEQQQTAFAFLAALLFATYPFHNEAVVWLTGRISSIACLFALLALNISFSRMHEQSKLLLMALCYLVGLLAYESIILLPLIYFLFIPSYQNEKRRSIGLAIFWITVMILYLIARKLLSGAVYGDYGERMVAFKDLGQYLENFFKVLGRTILPPMEDSRLLRVLFILVAVILCLWLYIKRRALGIKFSFSDKFVRLSLCFLVSLLLPVLFGVSTRTSEGDRMLYFPSVFLCMMISFLIVKGIRSTSFKWLSAAALLFYFIYFLQKNNSLWEKASSVSENIMDVVSGNSGNVVLINIPSELEGAFVFRNGFNKALRVHEIDTARVRIVNYLTREDYLKPEKNILPQKFKDTLFIFPETRVFRADNGNYRCVNRKNDTFTIIDTTSVYYWDKEELKKVF